MHSSSSLLFARVTGMWHLASCYGLWGSFHVASLVAPEDKLEPHTRRPGQLTVLRRDVYMRLSCAGSGCRESSHV